MPIICSPPQLPAGYWQCKRECLCAEILGVPILMQCIIHNLTYQGMWGNFLGGEFLLAFLRGTYQ
eukprot:7047069-Ditylum_brightwellii.AAC.1